MKNADEKWNTFYNSGKISDYLKYKGIDDGKVQNADNNGGRGDKGTPHR